MFGSSFFQNFGIPDIGAAMPEAYGANSPIMDPLARGLIATGKSAVDMLKAPGQLMQSNPYPEGSEAGQFFEDSRQKGMEDWSRNMASVLTLGAGAVPAEANSLRAGAGIFREAPEIVTANENLPLKERLPAPLSLEDRAWQNYGKFMSPDDVMQSETVWGSAKRWADAGKGEAEGFAHMANEMWRRMGANRYITPEIAKRYMTRERSGMKMTVGPEETR